MPSATIKLFLVHGDAKRLRTAELSNWTGKAVAGPRSELDGVLAREETAIHEEDLIADWQLVVIGKKPFPIRGLDQ